MDDTIHYFGGFGPGALSFFKALAENNDRDWFLAHKADYERACRAPMMDLVADLNSALATRKIPLFAEPKRAIFRINRDIRFAKDKSPYKTNIGAVLTRDGNKHTQGVLYVHLGLEGGFTAFGFHLPDPDQLALLRDRIVARRGEWRRVVDHLSAAGLRLSSDSAAARLPRGYDRADVGDIADFLRLKSFTVSRTLTDEELADPGLVTRLADFAALGLPLLDFGWQALATRVVP